MEDSCIQGKLSIIQTDCSPSHLFNNLSYCNKNLLFIHNSEIQPRIIIIDKQYSIIFILGFLMIKFMIIFLNTFLN